MSPPLSGDAKGSSTTSPSQAKALSRPESCVDGHDDVKISEKCGTADSMDQSPVRNNVILSPGLKGYAVAVSSASTEPIAEA